MAENTTDPVSPEAFERVKRERDDLKSKVEDATRALRDVQLRDAAADLLRQKGVADPYRAAGAAIRDVTLKGLTVEQLPEKLDGWLAEQKALWGAPAGTADTPALEATPSPARQSPYAGPNPGAPGTPATFEPMVVGSARWSEWAKTKTGAEQVAAVKAGQAVISDDVRRAQGSVKTGPL